MPSQGNQSAADWPPGRLDNFSDHGETPETMIERGVLEELLAIWLNSLRDGVVTREFGLQGDFLSVPPEVEVNSKGTTACDAYKFRPDE